ncbi:MAG: hypothetical protein AAB967_02890 [Patescibacteria group bacterium]
MLTFGKIILFKNNNYVWLVPDPEEEKIHLAIILDKEKTRLLRRADDVNAKKYNSSSDSPLFAYVVLTMQDYQECAAHLKDSDGYVDNKDDFSVLGELNNNDIAELKKRILDGTGLPARLVNLIKNLDNGEQKRFS